MHSVKKMVLMCDPPSGWKYGFPKAMPQRFADDYKGFIEWLVKEGYPKSEIDKMGDYFYCKYWQEEVKSA